MEKVYNIVTIIVTYNSMRWIEKTLTSLLNSSISTNILVIDNCSSDNTRIFIEQNFPTVQLVPNQVNLGFGKANNIGIKMALEMKADFVFLLNHDAWVYEATIKELISQMNPNAVLSPIHLNGNGTALDNNFKDYLITSLNNNTLLDDFLTNKLGSNYESNFINAAAWFIPIQIIKKIGGFNPLFFHYGEDVNFYQRMNYHNFEFRIIPNSFICHDRQSFGNKELFNRKLLLRNLLLYYSDINESLFSFSKGKLELVYKSIAKLIIFIVTFRIKRGYNILKAYCNFFLLLPKVISNRKKEKIIGLNWL